MNEFEIALTVCVIGRNEAKNLPRLISSLEPLQGCSDTVECIYVDSSSSDNSIQITQAFFDKSIILKEDPHLSASAGRYIGTLNASGKWVLYLDGDMELSPKFITSLIKLIKSQPLDTGYIGQYSYYYDNGLIRKNALGFKGHDIEVRFIGGSVLLPKDLVLRAGNWNPRLYSNEEIELYSRIRLLGGKVLFIYEEMIIHYAPYRSKVQSMFDHIYPSRVLGKKFYGFGQVLCASIHQRTLKNLVFTFPYPFVLWSGLVVGLTFFLFGQTAISLVIVLLTVVYVSYCKGIKFIFLYITFIFQAIAGFGKYNKEFVPVIKRIAKKSSLK